MELFHCTIYKTVSYMGLVHDYFKNIIYDNADKRFWIERVIEEVGDVLDFKEGIVHRNGGFYKFLPYHVF